MLGLSASYNYLLFNGSVDMRKGIYSLSAVVRDEMSGNPLDGSNVYIFMPKIRKKDNMINIWIRMIKNMYL